MACRYGSEPQPDAPLDGGILYLSDLGIPSSSGVVSSAGQELGDQTLLVNRLNQRLRIIDSPATFSGDLTHISIDVQELLGHVTRDIDYFSPTYNFIPIYSNDITGFCDRRPTIDDIPASLFQGIPFIDAQAYRQYCLGLLQERFFRYCRCRPAPPTPGCQNPQLAGRGQCDCEAYDFKVITHVTNPYTGLGSRTLESTVWGPVNFRFVILAQLPGDDYPRVKFQRESKGSTGLQANGAFDPPCGETATWADLTLPTFFNPSIPPTYDIEYIRFASMPQFREDNCCEEPDRDPVDPPDDPAANDGNGIYDSPGEGVTIVIVPGFCVPEACTTLPGSPGVDGEDGEDGADGLPGADGADGLPGAKGDKGDKGDNGLPGADGLPGLPGADGADGLPGVDGADGADGADGLPGVDGADGAIGERGERGERGADGLPGADGADGADGLAGATGDDGADGLPGLPGEKGDKGDKGDKSKITLRNVRIVPMGQSSRAIHVNAGSPTADPIYDLEISDSVEIDITSVKQVVCSEAGVAQLIDASVPVLRTRDGTTAGLFITLFGELNKILLNMGCIIDEQEESTVLDIGFSTTQQRVFYVPIESDLKSVIFRIVGALPSSLTLYSSTNEAQTKFGNICLTVDGNVMDSDPGWIWTVETVYRIPETRLGGRQIRLNLKPDLQWQLIDTGER